MKQKNNKGFTIIELLVVIAIIGLLATLAILSLRSAQSRARDTKRVSDAKNLQTAVELYYSINGTYPNPGTRTWAELQNELKKAGSETVTALPKPPIATEKYMYATNGKQYIVDTGTIENPTNQALNQDIDGTQPTSGSLTGWTVFTSDDTAFTGTTIDCGTAGSDTQYCLTE